jgi:hypothetical protein
LLPRSFSFLIFRQLRRLGGRFIFPEAYAELQPLTTVKHSGKNSPTPAGTQRTESWVTYILAFPFVEQLFFDGENGGNLIFHALSEVGLRWLRHPIA